MLLQLSALHGTSVLLHTVIDIILSVHQEKKPIFMWFFRKWLSED